MSILPGRHRPEPPVPVITERCDRCGGPGRVRVGKHVATLSEYEGQPHAVDSRELDLVFCAFHFDMHRSALSQRGWRLIEAAR